MSERKPQVFPTPEERKAAIERIDNDKVLAYENEKYQEVNSIYVNSMSVPKKTEEIPNGYDPNNHASAVEQMRLRTEQQLKMRNKNGDFNSAVVQPELAEKQEKQRVVQTDLYNKSDEQMKLRDEQLRKNKEMIERYQYQANQASSRPINNVNQNNEPLYPQTNTQKMNNNENNYVPPTNPPINNGYGDNFGKNPSNINPYILELSQPNYNSPFDVIPLPSQGKLYKSKKPNVRVSYMTASDENILTSPNLLQSGEFLQILIDRKVLEPELRYKDLHVGDRNAIMLWLRATAYGEMYPVTLLDENNVPFDTEIDLNSLKIKNLGAEPDENGLFSFTFPLSKAVIKFKLLTCGDIDAIERLVAEDKENGVPVNNSNIYTLERTIVEVNGDRNKESIKSFCSSIRISDAKKFDEYVDKIESGMDLKIEVRTPGGGSIKTFLPLNLNFFWPNAKL